KGSNAGAAFTTGRCVGRLPAGVGPARPGRERFMKDFPTLFGCLPTVVASAPGRVNLIGEHTDYNGGFVLPTAIPQRTQVELSPRDDRLVHFWSDAPGCSRDRMEYRLGTERPGQGWLDYVQGVTKELEGRGFVLGGFNARLTSTVPMGSGLSSS